MCPCLIWVLCDIFTWVDVHTNLSTHHREGGRSTPEEWLRQCLSRWPNELFYWHFRQGSQGTGMTTYKSANPGPAYQSSNFFSAVPLSSLPRPASVYSHFGRKGPLRKSQGSVLPEMWPLVYLMSLMSPSPPPGGSVPARRDRHLTGPGEAYLPLRRW